MTFSSSLLRRSAIGLLGVVLTALLLVAAFTLTEVGRDVVRQEVERQFARAFDGILEIGEIRGDLFRTVHATDVRMTDAEGRLVLRVDSVTFRPSWRTLVDRTFTSGRIELYGPYFIVTYTAGGPNLEAFFRGADRASEGPAWSLDVADVRVHNGSLSTRNEGYHSRLIDEGFVYDYTSSSIRSIDGRVRLTVRGDDTERVVNLDLRGLRGNAVWPALGETHIAGSLKLSADGLNVAGVRLTSGNSSLDFAASYGGTSADAINLQMDEASIGSDLVRAIIPRFPYADRAVVSLHLTGVLDDLLVERLAIARGESDLNLQGRIHGLPDRLQFEVDALSATLTFDDLAALDPSLEDDRLRNLGTVLVTSTSSGSVAWSANSSASSGSGTLAIRSDIGQLEGPFQISMMESGTRIETSLRIRDVVPDSFMPFSGRTRLSGHVDADIRFDRSGHPSGNMNARLGPSVIAGRATDSLRIDARISGGVLSGSALLQADGGRAVVSGRGLRNGAEFVVETSGRVSSLDVASLTGSPDVQTRLSGAFEIASSWSSLGDLRLDIDADFDSSTVSREDQDILVPAHRIHATLDPVGSGFRAHLDGDAFLATVESDVDLATVMQALEAWRPRLSDIVSVERAKRRHEPAPSAPVVAPARTSPPAFVMSFEGEALRPDLLAAFIPAFGGMSGNIQYDLRARSTGDSLHTALALSSDALAFHGLEGKTLDARASLAISAEESWPRGTMFTAALRADTISTANEHFRRSQISATLSDGQGAISFSTVGSDDDEKLLLRARTAIGTSYNRLTIDALDVEARGQQWSLTSTQALLQYADAVVVPSIELTSHSHRTSALQRLRFEGALSPSPTDTLTASIHAVSLRDITGMINLKGDLDGILDGRISITGLLTRPEVTGELVVPRLLFDGRPLGRMTVASTYVPGRTDIELDARLSPITEDDGARPDAGIIAGAAANDLRLIGRFRLPVPAADQRSSDPGMLDLSLDARSAHPFFFETIFRGVIRDVDGVLRGTGTISGDFRRPVFNAQVSLRDGQVRVPAFDLAYRVTGDATVDRDGIRLHGVRAADATGGVAVVDGGIMFNEYRYFSLDLLGRLHNTQFMNVLGARDLAFYGDVRGSGTVSLTGPLHNAVLQTNDASISPESRIFIAIQDEGATTDPGFIVFANSDGSLPDFNALSRRETLLARPVGERPFLDGLEMDLTFAAPQNVTVHLVIDPLLGDVINATGSGRIQLQRLEGDYYTFGTFNVTSGDYLFTAGDVFVRRFLIDGGSISWDGPPNNAVMDLRASYRTRASPAGLNLPINSRTRIPLIVQLHITDRVSAPLVELHLAIDRSDRETITAYESIEALLNQPDRSAEYATSVLLTNSFLLTTSMGTPGDGSITSTRNQLAFTSLSQLVSSQLNRYLNHALPNLDVNVGFLGESTQDLDVTYGVALSLLDERLIIRGQGLYQNESAQSAQQNLLDEFVVEVRLSNTVSVEVFYRREGDILGADQTLANTTGAGLSYETQFTTWARLVDRLFGWMRRTESEAEEDAIAAGASSSTY